MDELMGSLVDWLLNHGINPVYFFTLIALLVQLLGWRGYMNRKNLHPLARTFLSMSVFGTVVLVIASIMVFFFEHKGR